MKNYQSAEDYQVTVVKVQANRKPYQYPVIAYHVLRKFCLSSKVSSLQISI
jgi:hypothetical protein